MDLWGMGVMAIKTMKVGHVAGFSLVGGWKATYLGLVQYNTF